MDATPSKKGQMIIVSNRLPVSIIQKGGEMDFKPSDGGLASGLGSFYKDYEQCWWMGWPGLVPQQEEEKITEKLAQLHCAPVFMKEDLVTKFYEGFSNTTIWPLFHSFPAYTQYSKSDWDAYKEANLLFCDAILKIAKPGDVVWVHDYHLMLLPHYLRERINDLSIGFFLHIPFPSYDVFRLLPWHKQILESLLESDLLGYHTYDYMQAFLGSVRKILGYESNLGIITAPNRGVYVDVFPIGIDFQRFASAPTQPKGKEEIANIKSTLGTYKIIFSISRLDYTKGIPESLAAIEHFFATHPEWHRKVIYVLVIIPSRENVEMYAKFKRDIDEEVSKINSKYGSLGWMPVMYLYRTLSFHELVALYSIADVGLVIPRRDGMNLIAKEYLAAKTDNTGVLVLSDLAGAAKELLESVLVNPNSKEEVAEAIDYALEMPVEEQKRRNQTMRERLEKYNIRVWAEKFLHRLDEAVSFSKNLSVRMLDEDHRKKIWADYKAATKRLLLLDYDGTLVSFASTPERAKPDDHLLSILDKLTKVEQNEVVILSGRDGKILEDWFGGLKINLVAEHGGWIKMKNDHNWQMSVPLPPSNWYDQIRPFVELFVDRIPGSFIEEKKLSLVWHYRRANADSAEAAAKDLLDMLSNLTSNLPLQILAGKKNVEVRIGGISKGNFYTHRMAQEPWDFILAIGDDRTDEDLFKVLPSAAYSIKVGRNISYARFNLESWQKVRAILAGME